MRRTIERSDGSRLCAKQLARAVRPLCADGYIVRLTGDKITARDTVTGQTFEVGLSDGGPLADVEQLRSRVELRDITNENKRAARLVLRRMFRACPKGVR